MRTTDPDTLRDNARRLRHEELARMVREAAIKWSAFRKAFHAPLPRQVPATPHA